MRMGEEANSIYLTGCPAIDLVAEADLNLPSDFFEKYTVLETNFVHKDYIIVLQHPVTTEYGMG